MKKCSYCEAEILDEAVYCVNCHSHLDRESSKYMMGANEKVCPSCQSSCVNEAVICVNCGYAFSVEKIKKHKQKTTGIFKYIAMGIAILMIIVNVIIVMRYYEYAVYLGEFLLIVVTSIYSILFNVLVIIGLLKGKSKIIGIMYVLNIPKAFITTFLTSPILSPMNVCSFAISIIIAMLISVIFLAKKKCAEIIYLLPCVLSGISIVLSMIASGGISSLMSGIVSTIFVYCICMIRKSSQNEITSRAT